MAQKLTKMGFRGSQTAELVFEDMVVPRKNIAVPNTGHQVVMVVWIMNEQRSLLSTLESPRGRLN